MHTTPSYNAPTKLDTQQIQQHIASTIPTWQYKHDTRDTIHKQYRFRNFIDCFSYMTSIALYAETNQHHPEWFNVYNTLNITLSTHDCNGISSNDINMAKYCDDTAMKYKLQ